MKQYLKFSACIIFLIFFSCNGDDTPKPDLTNSSILSKSENKVLRNQEIAFYDMDGTIDNTAYATFYVNNMPIEGNKFSSPTEGIFQVYSRYNLEGVITTSQTDSFEVYIPRKKALIEGFTGTWCGSCPYLKIGFDKARDSIKNLVLVSIHVNSILPFNDDDPFAIPEGMILKDFFEIPGVPLAHIDRQPDYWSYYIVDMYPLREVTPFSGIDTDISLAINSELTSNTLSVNVKIISETEISNTKLVVFLLEDGLLHDQENYLNEDPESPFYQMGNPIPNYQHDDVLRVSITNPLGNEVPETSALTEYSVDFNVNIPSEYNPSKLKLVATLLDENNLVRNTQQAPINEFQDFE